MTNSYSQLGGGGVLLVVIVVVVVVVAVFQHLGQEGDVKELGLLRQLLGILKKCPINHQIIRSSAKQS